MTVAQSGVTLSVPGRQPGCRQGRGFGSNLREARCFWQASGLGPDNPDPPPLKPADMVIPEDLMQRLAAADFRTTVEYTGPLEHQYVMTHFREDYPSLWLDMRELIATTGVVRPFRGSREEWRYVDLPDGYTYWVMPEWAVDGWEEGFDPDDTYVLNRQETPKHLRAGAG